MANPFQIVDTAILEQLRGHAALTAIVAATNIRAYDRAINLADPATNAKISPHIWILPDDSPVDPYYGGNECQILLRYNIGYLKHTAAVPDLRAAQFEIMRAFLWMAEYKTPGGAAGSLVAAYDPAPFKWDAITPTKSGVTGKAREDNMGGGYAVLSRWQALFNVTVNLVGPTASVLAANV